MVSKQIRDKLAKQVQQEKEFARQWKDGLITNWHKNEDMYYGRKGRSDQARSNVQLAKMQGFIHTALSKIDTPLDFKYTKATEADLKKAKIANAIKEQDGAPHNGNWGMKDLVGKKQALIYGRAIYCYYASSPKGEYESHLENVDVYDYLIDPSAGGIDIEDAYYMGRYGVVKSRQELKEGVKKGLYLRNEVSQLLNGSANNEEMTEEEVDKENRYMNLVDRSDKELFNNDKFKFWEWWTTSAEDGKRYYLLLTDNGQIARCEEWKDIDKSDLYPFWTWAVFPDLTEFWTPSYADYAREIFMAQDVVINQMLDNGEATNKPMRGVDVTKVLNLGELRYRKDGVIRFKGDTDINQAYKIMQTPSIDTPLKVYETLETIQQIESGVTGGAKGVADEDKVGIYEGNQANAADRFGLLNKSYTNAYHRFALLHWNGIEQNLTKKMAVKMMGADGVEVVTEVSRRDVIPKRNFDFSIVSSDAETQMDLVDKKNKIAFLREYAGNDKINQKASFEIGAEIVGFNKDAIKMLLDTENTYQAELMAEAARDIETILNGTMPNPNIAATTAYKKKLADYMFDQAENLSDKQFEMLAQYILSIEPYVMRNSVMDLRNKAAQEGNLGKLTGGELEGEPVENTFESEQLQENVITQ